MGLFYYYQTFAKTMALLGKPTDQSMPRARPTTGGPELTAALAKRQHTNGSWINPADRFMEGDPNLVTAYALLALAATPSPRARPRPATRPIRVLDKKRPSPTPPGTFEDRYPRGSRFRFRGGAGRARSGNQSAEGRSWNRRSRSLIVGRTRRLRRSRGLFLDPPGIQPCASLLLTLGLLIVIPCSHRARIVRRGPQRPQRRSEGSKEWVYNNLEEGRRSARESGKPMFVIFRCILRGRLPGVR